MALNKRVKAAIARLMLGWGFMEGKWVYVPLWDPAPNQAQPFRQLIAASALRDLTIVLNEHDTTRANTLKSLADKLFKQAMAGMNQAWEEGDPICPPYPPFPKGTLWPPFPVPGPVPDYKAWQKLNPAVRGATLGNMVSAIGTMIDEEPIVTAGNAIMIGG